MIDRSPSPTEGHEIRTHWGNSQTVPPTPNTFPAPPHRGCRSGWIPASVLAFLPIPTPGCAGCNRGASPGGGTQAR